MGKNQNILPIGPWMFAGFVSWAAMSWMGDAGKSDNWRVWHRVGFWSILAGGISLSVALFGLHIRQNGALVWSIAVGMTIGAVVRFAVAQIRGEAKLQPQTHTALRNRIWGSTSRPGWVCYVGSSGLCVTALVLL